jgi:hypothetical protein
MDKTENHLNYNPWLRGIYDEAKGIAASDKGTVLEPGLSELDLNSRAEVIRRGDFKFTSPLSEPVQINNEATAVPEAYFSFLYIIGGFKCRSVQLYHLGGEYLYNDHGRTSIIANVEGPSVRERVVTGKASSYHREFDLSYPIQIILGRCDHGEYVYDRRYDSYFLARNNGDTYFNNCGDMLSHAMYRVRENIKEKWGFSMSAQNFYVTEEFKNFISGAKESGMNIVPDEEKVFGPHENRDIDYDEIVGNYLNCFNETIAEKSYYYFLGILKNDNDDFLTYLRSRFTDPSQQLLYYEVITELILFTALRYHDAYFDGFIGKAHQGASKMGMHISWLRSFYLQAFEKKAKSKKK